MTAQELITEYENLPPEEKKEFSSFHDYLGSMAWCLCETCGEAFEYDEVDENGDCCDCGETEE